VAGLVVAPRSGETPGALFEGDSDSTTGSLFCQEALKRGVYLHPKHNMFLWTAHTEADIDEALAVTAEALAVVANRR
jgi:glutamate-1-semialdehyde 2,1-aminomutase